MSVESFAPRTLHSTASSSIRSHSNGWSDRLLADAASQLYQPLSRMTESIASVIATDSGQLTALQRERLGEAVVACEQMEAMVTGLHRLNRRQEHGAVHRRWCELSSLKTDAERLIRERLPHRRNAIRWHGFDASRRVYGDSAVISGLMSGLIGSAMRHAGGSLVGGRAILVRANCPTDRQNVRLSVSVEDGCFFAGVAGTQPASIVNEKDDWVELASWRSSAAALFTHPEIVLRPNGGWEIAFELPIDSPASVTSQWARWRQSQQSRVRPSQAEQSTGDSINRLLCGLMSADVGPGPIHATQASMLTVVAGAAVLPQTVDAFHNKLECDLGMYDFAYRVSSRRWLVVWDVDAAQARTRIETLASGNLDSASPIRLHWSTIGVLPIRAGQTARILSDRIARELLSDSETGQVAMDQTAEATEFRPSSVPSDRLMAEMRHLAARVRLQNEQLIGQARQLRPAMRESQ